MVMRLRPIAQKSCLRQYESPLASVHRRHDACAMKLRVVSAVVWFLAGWVIAGGIAVQLGINQGVGALVGVAWAAFVAIDPKDLIWHVRSGSANGSPGASPRSTAQQPQVGTGS